MEKKIAELHARSVKDLPVGKDIPRLADKIEVVDRVGKAVKYKAEECTFDPSSQLAAVRKFFFAVVSALEPDVYPGFAKKFDTFRFSGEGDGTVQQEALTEFLSSMPADSKSLAVIKSINQSILAPAVSHLMIQIAPTHPYKDMPGGWHVVVCVANPVTVTHRRTEQSLDGTWTFDWQLRLSFDSDTTTLQKPTLKMSGFHPTEKCKEKVQDDMRTLLQKFNSSVRDFL